MSASAAKITGERKQWHAVTLTFNGPKTSEAATPNPFTDYRLNVTFTHTKTGKTYLVPGYYAADGKAADTGAEAGNKWRVHFSPDQTGKWKWTASFRKGDKIAVSDDAKAGESAGYMDGKKGTFNIRKSNKKAPDFRARGRLNYVGGHYLQFAETKEYFLKEGTDAPENLLAYADFDGDFKTDGHKDNFIKTWDAHVKDWKKGDPTWQKGKGKGLIGALNYLASEGLNAFSFLTFNIEGDDRNVFPYTSYTEKFRFDVSRLDQWGIVFEHGQSLGLFLHFKTQESENETWHDNGEVGVERKLYYRQLIARFGHHLALNWNLGEENGSWGPNHKKKEQSTAQRRAMAQYFWDHDPYRHHIVIHNGRWFDDLSGDQSKITGISLQTNKTDFSRVHSQTLRLINESVKAGKLWAIACDEPGDAGHSLVPDKDDPTHNDGRMNALWGNLMAGGWGCEYYFGYQHDHSDLTCQDFRSRDDFWDQCRYALQFFDQQDIPFWQMQCKDDLTWQKNDYCFIKDGQIYLIYQKQGGPLKLDLSDGKFEYGYFNPRTGEGADALLNKKAIAGPKKFTFTAPDNKDWLLVIRSKDGGKVTQSEKPKPAPKAPKAAADTDSYTGIRLRAVQDFTDVSNQAYKDMNHKALAVNAAQHKDVFATAKTAFNGPTETYNITLNTLTETDGESAYELLVNDTSVGTYTNPPTTTDYAKSSTTWQNVKLKKGDTLKVRFNSVSNKKKPEGDSFGYSRGRWTDLTLEPVSAAKPKPQGKIIESLYKGQIFKETDGLLEVEAEHFAGQEKTDLRQWYITTAESVPGIQPDGDPSHAADASGGAYIENLPDTRRTHADKLTGGVNFSNIPGKMAILSYPVVINTPGRYYVWVRAYSTGSEDNGLHVGIDGTWPESGARLQWCEGKKSWRWESKQRTEKVHCGVPYKIFLDIEKPGPHLIQFSMREDGFEFDKWLMTVKQMTAKEMNNSSK